MKQNKIHNLQSLLEEKMRLTSIVKLQEEELNDRALFFESNYKSIIWKNINPLKGETTINEILKTVTTDVLPIALGVITKSSMGMLLGKGIIRAGTLILKKLQIARAKNTSKENKNGDSFL